MAFLEGIADEWLQIAICACLIIFFALLWLSTRVNDDDMFTTLYVLERFRASRGRIVESLYPNTTRNLSVDQPVTNSRNFNYPLVENTNSNSIGASIRNTLQNLSIMPRRRRNARRNRNSDGTQPAQSTSGEQQTELENSQQNVINSRHTTFFRSIYNNMFNSRGSRSNQNNTSGGNNSNMQLAIQEEKANTANIPDIDIKFRLKFVLNDDIRQVEGPAQETIFDFKKRNFETELAENKSIRFIFNGKLLRNDNETLYSYGVRDDCVVHCLIGSNKPNEQPISNTDMTPVIDDYDDDPEEPEWNLGPVVFITFLLLLSIAWICRFQFSYLYSITATALLTCLTILFIAYYLNP